MTPQQPGPYGEQGPWRPHPNGPQSPYGGPQPWGPPPPPSAQVPLPQHPPYGPAPGGPQQAPHPPPKRASDRKGCFFAALLIVAVIAVPGTIAYLTTERGPLAYQGREYTCEQISGTDSCNTETNELFQDIKGNIPPAYESGRLGVEYNNHAAHPFADTANLIFIACADKKQGLTAQETVDRLNARQPGSASLAAEGPVYDVAASMVCP